MVSYVSLLFHLFDALVFLSLLNSNLVNKVSFKCNDRFKLDYHKLNVISSIFICVLSMI